MSYDKRIGRVRLEVSNPPSVRATLHVLAGFHEDCEWMRSFLSPEELRDLRYLIDRALASLESKPPQL